MSSGKSAHSGFQLRVVARVDSTTAELLRQPCDLVPAGTAMLAFTQSGGRGRSERVWESGKGGMYLSVVLRPSDPRGLSLIGAKAILTVIDRYGLEGQLRWPNDVFLFGRKVGGVLPVVRYQGNVLERAVLGVGLNICQSPTTFSEDLRPYVTTLSEHSSQVPRDVTQVAQAYLQALQSELEAFEDGGMEGLCSRCEPFLDGLGGERTPALVEPGKAAYLLPPIAGLLSSGGLAFADGSSLEALGRQQRLKFEDEL